MDNGWIWGLAAGGAALMVSAIALAPRLAAWMRQREVQRALGLFRLRREGLEAKFFQLAAAGGKPRGLRWTHCEWKDDVRFAHDLSTGLLTAFVGVEIHFEAIEGGDMEDVEAVGHFREASAVFHCQNGVWGTGGKALFNLSPEEAVTRLEGQFAAVEL